MLCKSINYYEDGMVTVLLSKDKKYKPVDRHLLAEYLSYPQTQQLHIYGITQEIYEQVLALVRFTKSLYNVPIFCYYDKSKVEALELPLLCEKTIHYKG